MSAGVTPAATPESGSMRRALIMSSSGTAGARLTGALGGLVAARLLGPAGRGQLAILVVLATAASMASAAGMQFWIAREVARSGGVRSAAWIAAVHCVVVVGATVAIGLVLAPAIGALADASAPAIGMTVLLAAAAGVNVVVLALPHGSRAMSVVAMGTIAAGGFYLCTTVILLALGRGSVTLVLLGAVCGFFASSCIAVAWAAKAPGGRARPLRSWREYRNALGFSWPAGAGELVFLGMLRVDVLIVAAFLPLRAVGLYAVATALAEALWIVPDGVALVVLPTTASDPEQTRTPRLLRATLLVTALGGVTLSLVAPEFLRLAFGPRFAGAATAVPCLALASLFGGAWKIVGAEVVARGRTKPRLLSAMVGLLVMVFVDLAAIPVWGIGGAAFGSACGYGMAAVVVVVAWSREVKRPIRDLVGASRLVSEPVSRALAEMS